MNYEPGQKVTWLYTTPGGWNWVIRVPATVVKATKSRVCIDAELKNGGTKRRYVKPENLVMPTQRPAPEYIGLPDFWQALATIADFMNAPYPLSVQYRDIVLRARWDAIRNQKAEYVTVNSAEDDAAYELRQEWEEYKKG